MSIFLYSGPLSKESIHVRGFLWIVVTRLFLQWWVVSLTPNHQAVGPPFFGCPRLLIQYIRSYPPYLEAVPSIRNLMTRHAVVTRDPPNMARICRRYKLKNRLDSFFMLKVLKNVLFSFLTTWCSEWEQRLRHSWNTDFICSQIRKIKQSAMTSCSIFVLSFNKKEKKALCTYRYGERGILNITALHFLTRNSYTYTTEWTVAFLQYRNKFTALYPQDVFTAYVPVDATDHLWRNIESSFISTGALFLHFVFIYLRSGWIRRMLSTIQFRILTFSSPKSLTKI
jgi:hypothetical protein